MRRSTPPWLWHRSSTSSPVERRAALISWGTFEVLNDDPSGMYYRMRDAKEIERFDDIRWTGQLLQQLQVTQ